MLKEHVKVEIGKYRITSLCKTVSSFKNEHNNKSKFIRLSLCIAPYETSCPLKTAHLISHLHHLYQLVIMYMYKEYSRTLAKDHLDQETTLLLGALFTSPD